MSGVRCFIGIPFDPPFVEACAAIRRVVTDADDRWRGQKWVPDENLHITLRFIGELRPEDVEGVRQTVGEIVESARSFELPLDSLKAVPNRRQCRMLWAGFFDPNGECASLARRLEIAVPRTDGKPEHAAFKAHATIVRTRRPIKLAQAAIEGADAALRAAPPAMSVSRVTLFSSELGGPAPIYRVVGTWSPLGA